MAKDPAVLFYTSDFLTGTILMNYEQKGKYITLLCIQHQHGIIDKNSFDLIVGNDIMIKSKFLENENGFYNQRMLEESKIVNYITEQHLKVEPENFFDYKIKV
jgi:hypothetical protein